MLGGGAGGKKLGHCLLCASFSFKFCLCSYLNNHSSETFHILSMETSRVCFHSMNPGLTVHAGGGIRGQKKGHRSKCYSTFLL